jgi:hypothetical protein
MDTTIVYDTILGLLANPPGLCSRPNFFNLRELCLHYARALKKIPCPQSAVNGWSGAVMSPAMYALVDTRSFTWNITTSPIPEFPARFSTNTDGTIGAELPYTQEEILTIRPQNPRYSNIVKSFANQNVCFFCGFDVEDWHTSASCTNRKMGHQTGFTRLIWPEYERANHQFCRKAMHKTMLTVRGGDYTAFKLSKACFSLS